MTKGFETEFEDDLRTLANALKAEIFRFVLIGHNHHSLYLDASEWVKNQFPARKIMEMRFYGKNYRAISDALQNFKHGIVLIPDFDWLFHPDNVSLCTAINQRRDFFARQNITLLCFIQPSSFITVAQKLPDWWSGRSLELSFYREVEVQESKFLLLEPESSSLGGDSRAEKEAELARLSQQLVLADPDDPALLINLQEQIARILFRFARYDEALVFLEKNLSLSRASGERMVESESLNNISQIHDARGEYDTALKYLEQSLSISQEIGYLESKSTTLNNIGGIHRAKGEYDTALWYLEQSLSISQEIGDRVGEGTALNNIGQIHKASGDYSTALTYLERSLKISQEIGGRAGEVATLNNISQVHQASGDYDTALTYLEQSLKISQEIGDIIGVATALTNTGIILFEQNQFEVALPKFLQAYQIFQKTGSPNAPVLERNLNTIREKIGEQRFQELMAQQG